MRILLDTHVAIWATENRSKLSNRTKALLTDPANIVFYSDINLWEVAIKVSTRRHRQAGFPDTPEDALMNFEEAGFERLAISAEHLMRTATLPLHHRDPFDRLLIAQALTEPMRLLTDDRQVAQYSDTVILA